MSKHEDLLTLLAMPVMEAYHGDASSVTLTPQGGSPTSYDAVIFEERREEVQRGDRIAVEYIRNVCVSQADVAAPVVNMKATVDSLDYKIRTIVDKNDGQWTLELRRAGISEFSRPGYRQRS